MIIKLKDSKWDISFKSGGLTITNISKEIQLELEDSKIKPNRLEDIVGLKQIEMK